MKSDDRQGLDRPLLVVQEPPDANPRRATASRGVWRRLVTRTQDPELNRFLTEGDFETFEFDGTDRGRLDLLARLGEGDVKGVLALGESAFNACTGCNGVLKLRGYSIPGGDGVPTVGTYAPSYIMAGKFNLARVVQTDLIKALRIARHGIDYFHRDKEYITQPSIEGVLQFISNWEAAGKPPIAFDIETPWSDHKDEAMTFEEDSSYTILMCSFAFEECKAISIPWMPPYIDAIKYLLGQAPQALVWNAKFDVPRLMANGVDFGGEIIDVMIAWHWLEPSLPMGLKFVAPFICPDMDAWALERKQDFAKYNCGDSDVLLRAFFDIKSRLQQQSRWEIFERHFLKFGKILTRMTKRGINVDLEVRRESRKEFELEFETVVSQVKTMAPSEVRPLHPKKGYKKSEAELKKAGIWEEGSMRCIEVEISDEEHEKITSKQARKAEREAAKEAKRVAREARPRKARPPKRQQVLDYEPM